MNKLATLAITMILCGGAYLLMATKASAASIQVAPGEGISHAAKKAGCNDFASSVRWQNIASQNGSSNWQSFNSSLTPGKIINVSCGTVTPIAANTTKKVSNYNVVAAQAAPFSSVNQFRHPVLGFTGIISQGMHPGHNGVDFAMNGSPSVVAVTSGTIEWQGWSAYGGGNEIRIRLDNGMLAVYSHTRGDFRASGRVYPGQVLATMGCTGNCTGQHLHFELWNGNYAVNPFAYIR